MSKTDLKTKTYSLKELVILKAGYPFRGKIKGISNGSVNVVQAKDISEHAELKESDLIKTELTGKRKPDWLMQDDIIIINKGHKNTAAHISKNMESTTIAPTLFILKVRSNWKNKINMKFLAWQLNQAPIQNYFRRSMQGSKLVTLRRQVIEDALIGIPPLKEQETLVKIYENGTQQQKVLATMMRNINHQMTALAQSLIENQEKKNKK